MAAINNDLLGQMYSAYTLRLFEKLEDQIVRYFTEMMKHCYKASPKKQSDIPEVYGMFQTMCIHHTQWSMAEMDRQRNILQKALGHKADKLPDPNLWISMTDKDFNNLVVTILKLHFSVLAVVRTSDIDEIVLPKVDVNRFIWKCFEKVALSVAKRSPHFFDSLSFSGKERLKNHAEAIRRVQQCLYSVLNDFVPMHQLLSSSPRAKPSKKQNIPPLPPMLSPLKPIEIPTKKFKPKSSHFLSQSLRKETKPAAKEPIGLHIPKQQIGVFPKAKSEVLPSMSLRKEKEKKIQVPISSFVVPKSPVHSASPPTKSTKQQETQEIVNEYFDQDDHDPIPQDNQPFVIEEPQTNENHITAPPEKIEDMKQANPTPPQLARSTRMKSTKKEEQKITPQSVIKEKPKYESPGTIDIDEDLTLISNLSSKYLATTPDKRSQSMTITSKSKHTTPTKKHNLLLQKPGFVTMLDQSQKEIQSMILPSVRSEAPKPAFMKLEPEELKSRSFFQPKPE